MHISTVPLWVMTKSQACFARAASPLELDLQRQMFCLILTLQLAFAERVSFIGQRHREEMAAAVFPVLSESHAESASKDKFIFLCKYLLFHIPKPTTQKEAN